MYHDNFDADYIKTINLAGCGGAHWEVLLKEVEAEESRV